MIPISRERFSLIRARVSAEGCCPGTTGTLCIPLRLGWQPSRATCQFNRRALAFAILLEFAPAVRLALKQVVTNGAGRTERFLDVANYE